MSVDLDSFLCLQSCTEMQAEAVDYLQQDNTFASGQAAETLALVVDATVNEHEMLAMQKLVTEVLFLTSLSSANTC